MDAALHRPAGFGAWPAVIVWPDIVGLRPVFREMGARLAAEGYVVLTPNPFYRSAKTPVFPNDAMDMAKANEYRKLMTPAAVARDGIALMAYLDSLAFVNKRATAGTVGYCMGGPMTMQTAAAVPGRIGAGCSFHGAGLVTDGPDSPHLLVPKMKASYYFGIATNDDMRQPDAKDKLKAASLRPPTCPRPSRSMKGPCTVGACPVRPSTTSPKPSAPTPI